MRRWWNTRDLGSMSKQKYWQALNLTHSHTRYQQVTRMQHACSHRLVTLSLLTALSPLNPPSCPSRIEHQQLVSKCSRATTYPSTAGILGVFCLVHTPCCRAFNGRMRVGWVPRVANPQRFFQRLGTRVREFRRKQGYSQEDMISYGFSARHWQQIEAGRPITVSTLLRICAVFETSLEQLVRGLDLGIYED